jgi:hypothetical protein
MVRGTQDIWSLGRALSLYDDTAGVASLGEDLAYAHPPAVSPPGGVRTNSDRDRDTRGKAKRKETLKTLLEALQELSKDDNELASKGT